MARDQSPRPQHRGAARIGRVRDAESLQLVRRIQAGEAELVAVLYERYFDDLYGYLSSLVRRDEVEDVLQRFFERLIQALQRYEPRTDASFRGWLFRIARNEALDCRRERDPAEALPPDQLTREIEDQGSRLGQIPLVSVGWVSDAALAVALRALPLIQREVIVLYYAADLPLKDAALVLGISGPAVRQHHRRALIALQEHLSGKPPTNGPKKPLAMRQLTGVTSSRMGGSFSVAHP